MTPEQTNAIIEAVSDLIRANLPEIMQQEPNKRGQLAFSVSVKFCKTLQVKISVTERHTDETDVMLPDGQKELPL